MTVTISPFNFHTTKVFDKNDQDEHVGQYPTADIAMHSNKTIVMFGAAIKSDVPFKVKQSESMVVQSSSLLDMCTGIQAKRQAKILSKVKSAKDNIIKMFKTNGRIPPAISNLVPFTVPYVQHQDNESSHLSLPSISQSAVPRVSVVTVSDSIPPSQSKLEVVNSLVAHSERVVEERVKDLVPVLRSVAEVSSPSLPTRLLTAPEPQRTPRSTFPLNELHTIEEEVGNLEEDAEEVHLEPDTLTISSSCPLPMSDSEAKYDAMLAAEFATFSFGSDDIQEWTNEVERSKQAKMDSHFAYVSQALATPVPKLSAYFSSGNPADYATVDKDEIISDLSPVKTEASETNMSSADSYLVINLDAEESRPQFSPTIVRALRRVRNYEDLRNLQVITDCNDSFPDLYWSFDLGLSDLPASGGKTGALRRSVRCNDLRSSFLSLEFGRCLISSRETRANEN